LDVSKGNIVELLSKDEDGWTRVELDGKIGLVPSNCIIATDSRIAYKARYFSIRNKSEGDL
jgi:hypothetical protein